MVDALGDDDEAVQRLALSAVGPAANSAVVKAIVALVQRSPSWSMRVRAAEALGRIAAAPSAVFGPLAQVAQKDSYALVREAAMRSLERVDRRAALPILRDRAEKDPEARLRQLAKELATHDASN
jgi:HEAT repeat protein